MHTEIFEAILLGIFFHRSYSVVIFVFLLLKSNLLFLVNFLPIHISLLSLSTLLQPFSWVWQKAESQILCCESQFKSFQCCVLMAFLCVTACLFCVTLYLCVSMSVTMCLCVTVCVTMYLCVCLCMWLSVWYCVSVCVTLCLCVWLCICMWLCDCDCVCVHKCALFRLLPFLFFSFLLFVLLHSGLFDFFICLFDFWRERRKA